MANRVNSVGKYPHLDYVNDFVDLTQNLIFEEALALGQITDRIQEQGFSFSDWKNDVWSMWTRAENNTRRLVYFPIRRQAARSKVMPHLVFLVDKAAEAAGPQVLELPEPLPLGIRALMTELRHDHGPPPIPKERILLVQASPGTLQVGLVNLNPAPGQGGPLGAPRPAPGKYTAIIYANGSAPRQALATVTVYMDIDGKLEEEAAPAIVPTPDPEPVPRHQAALEAAQRTADRVDQIAKMLQEFIAALPRR